MDARGTAALRTCRQGPQKKKRHKTIIHSTKNKSRPYWGGKVRRGRMKRPWGGEPGKKGRELGNTSPPTEY